MTQQEVKEQLGLSIGGEGVGNCEQLLESAGVLERMISSQNMAAVRLDSDLPTLVDLLPKQAKVRRRVLQAVERLVGPRRNELVHFQPRDLAAETELDPDSIANALRELNELGSFTYVPPFRGRAIRMIRRGVPFDELDIDFAEQETRKQAEYDKLDQVVRFALSSACRQQEILHYFGENDARGLRPLRQLPPRAAEEVAAAEAGRGAAPAGAEAGVAEAVRIVLSGVARTQARFPCGKNLIAQMLCGSASAKVAKLRLNQLSTFGLLSHLTQPEVVTLVEALVAAGYLEQVGLGPLSARGAIDRVGHGSDGRARQAVDARLSLPAYLLLKLRGAAAEARRPRGCHCWLVQQCRKTRLGKPTVTGHGTRQHRSRPRCHWLARPAAAPAGRRRAGRRITGPGGCCRPALRSRSARPPAGSRAEAVLDHALRAVEEGWRVEARWCLPPELIGGGIGRGGRRAAAADPPAAGPVAARHELQQVDLLKCRQPGVESG